MIGKFVINTAWLLLMVAISGLIYIRIAPHNSKLQHVDPPTGAEPDKPVIKAGSALFSQGFDETPDSILQRVNTVALATPRTKILAGSVEDGMVTYVTRSLGFGFPDYTTVRAVAEGAGSRLTIYGRLRFGKSDFGVNKQRINDWLQAL